MNDIGAARTELALAALATIVIGVDMRSAAFDLKAFSYAIWGMALNNAGWMLVSLIFVKRMSSAISKMNQKYNPAWVKLIMTGAAIGLFASLWSPALIKGGAALSQLWVFILAPLLGGALAALAYKGLEPQQD